MDRDKTLQKIAALLQHAEGTSNEHEMLAFVEAAQRLATAASLDIEHARWWGEASAQQSQLTQVTITMGEKRSKGLKNFVQLFVAIAQANDVKCDVLRDSTIVYAFGYDTDIDLCQQLYQSLVVQMVAACEEFMRSGQYKNDVVVKSETQKVCGFNYRVKRASPVAPVTARLNFYAAFAYRIGARLHSARMQELAEHRPQTTPAASSVSPEKVMSTELVIKSKEETVHNYYRQVSQARGSWSPTKNEYSRSASQAGDAAGRKAQLGIGKTEKISTTTRQLPTSKN